MANVFIEESTMQEIAAAIRGKTGGTALMLPGEMPAAIQGIEGGGGGDVVADPLDPQTVYNNTRPADWLPMPTPANNEIYLLFHIPEGLSSLIAFTVTCTANYTVRTGTVTNGEFVEQTVKSVSSGKKYEAELFADDYGDLTSDGFKQVMIKISGSAIKTWIPSTHSEKTTPAYFSAWNIVEIACRLPYGTSVKCGGDNAAVQALNKLRYFAWYGTNQLKNASNGFRWCYELITILALNTSKVTNMSYIFYLCNWLVAISGLDVRSVNDTTLMLFDCYSLCSIKLNPNVTGWEGNDISLANCSLAHQAIIDFFNSLPTITSSKSITLTKNPCIPFLSDADKAIATQKGWTLVL